MVNNEIHKINAKNKKIILPIEKKSLPLQKIALG